MRGTCENEGKLLVMSIDQPLPSLRHQAARLQASLHQFQTHYFAGGESNMESGVDQCREPGKAWRLSKGPRFSTRHAESHREADQRRECRGPVENKAAT